MSDFTDSIIEMHSGSDKSKGGLNELYCDPTLTCDEQGVLLKLRKDYGQGTLEILSPLPGFRMYMQDMTFSSPLKQLKGAGIESEDDLLLIRFSLHGEFEFAKGQQRLKNTPHAACMILYFPKGEVITSWAPEGIQNQGVSFYVTSKDFFESFGDHKSYPSPFKEIKSGQMNEVFYERSQITSSMIQATRDILNCTYTGKVRHTFLKAKGAELLCRYIETHPKDKKLAVRAQTFKKEQALETSDGWIEEIHFLIQKSYASPPSIDELCKHFGQNRNKLNHGFKQRYGMTIGQYTKQLKLDIASQELKNSNKSVSIIADELGYSHSSNFIYAFSSSYGMTPAQFRKAKST